MMIPNAFHNLAVKSGYFIDAVVTLLKKKLHKIYRSKETIYKQCLTTGM